MSSDQFPKYRIVDIAELVPYAQNSRKHTKAQIDRLAARILAMGFINPVVTDGAKGILAGHARVLAAEVAGLKRLPTIEASHLTRKQKQAYIIWDNKSALEATWDHDMLRVEFGSLITGKEFDAELTGFNMDFINQSLQEIGRGLVDEDHSPALTEHPVSKLGDVWHLGPHRLVCGDATDQGAVDKCLEGAKPMLMVTDPPYGVDYDPQWRARAGVNKNKGKMGEVKNDDRADWREVWALFPGDVAYVWHGGLHASEVADSLVAAGFEVRSQIIWANDRFALSRGHYHWQHEPCWYAVRLGSKANWLGDRSQSTLWNINARDDSGHGHSTQKPVECMRRPIENNSAPGDAVFDPFCGSGTTIIAAHTISRVCLAIELNPLYVDMAIKRWQDFTGEAAVHVQSGSTFKDLSHDEK